MTTNKYKTHWWRHVDDLLLLRVIQFSTNICISNVNIGRGGIHTAVTYGEEISPEMLKLRAPLHYI